MAGNMVSAHEGVPHDHGGRLTLFPRGVLYVEIYKAEGIKGDEINGMGFADPYLAVKLGVTGKPVKSEADQNSGSQPIWNSKFKFPLRNGGTKDHNVLEIEILNKNIATGIFRGDNRLGHLRIGNLADWILKHEANITGFAWFPVFYKHRRSSRDQMPAEQQGEILMKFYFEEVEDYIFAHGQHTDACCEVIGEASQGHAGDQRVKYDRVRGSRLSSVLGSLGGLAGIAQTVIVITGLIL